MGKAGAIVKLLSSDNIDDNQIGYELLETEDYYQYILDYMSEIINNNREDTWVDKEKPYDWRIISVWFSRISLKRRNK